LAATNAYLSEDRVAEPAKCIGICMDCADICDTTAQVLTRHTGYDANTSRALLGACAMARTSRGDECARHASMHEHCRICDETCRRRAHACRHLIAA
jgi:hypothetical protein